MKNFENDPRMPWNKKTWIDTFTDNSAFRKHAGSLMLAMNEIREEKKGEEKTRLDNATRLVNTYKMLLGLK